MTDASTTADAGEQGLGVVGLGVMGSAIATRLLDQRQSLVVYDKNPRQIAELKALGDGRVIGPDSLTALGRSCSVVILSLNTADIVRTVALEGGLLNSLPAGGLIIDMSSIDPETTRFLAARAREVRIGWVDSPLSGGAPKALRGELSLMLGGEPGDVERARPVLSMLSTRATHCGASGSGQVVKLLNQLIVGTAFVSLAEVSALTRAQGIDSDVVLQALEGGRADSPLLQEFFVKFATADPRSTGRISNMLKDLDGVMTLGRQVDRALPVTAAVAELHRWLVAKGLGDADSAALLAFYDSSVDDDRWTSDQE